MARLSPRISVHIKLRLYVFNKLYWPRIAAKLYFSEMNVPTSSAKWGGFAGRSKRALSFAKPARIYVLYLHLILALCRVALLFGRARYFTSPPKCWSLSYCTILYFFAMNVPTCSAKWGDLQSVRSEHPVSRSQLLLSVSHLILFHYWVAHRSALAR